MKTHSINVLHSCGHWERHEMKGTRRGAEAYGASQNRVPCFACQQKERAATASNQVTLTEALYRMDVAQYEKTIRGYVRDATGIENPVMPLADARRLARMVDALYDVRSRMTDRKICAWVESRKHAWGGDPDAMTTKTPTVTITRHPAGTVSFRVLIDGLEVVSGVEYGWNQAAHLIGAAILGRVE